MRNPFRPGRFADVVGNRIQRQVDDLARIGRDVGRAAMHQVAVEHQQPARLAGGRHDAAFGDQLRHHLIIQGPQG